MLSTTAPPDLTPPESPEIRFLAGTAFTSSLLDSLTELKPEAADKTINKIFILDRDDRSSASNLVQQFQAAGIEVKHLVLDQINQMLDVPTEEAITPNNHIESIVHWLNNRLKDVRQVCNLKLQPTTELRFNGTLISENVVHLGPHKLIAIESRPLAIRNDAVTVVFLNTGSEHHVGSGRVWVEFARRLATNGDVALRVDFRGWGESPDDGFAPGRPYDPHVVEDVKNIAQAIRERGDSKIVIVGLCAGAWAALRECWVLPIDGLIAFNPQLYWQPGDPVEALLSQTRARRANERSREQRLGKLGIWTMLDAVGIKGVVGNWLWRIARAPFPVAFLFAQNDDGIEYLQSRLARRLRLAQKSGQLIVDEIEGIDHPMHRHWYREAAYTALHNFVCRVR